MSRIYTRAMSLWFLLQYSFCTYILWILEQAQKQVEIQIKYDGYINHQNDEINKHQKNENTYLPLNFDYNNIPGLSKEVVMKLNDFKPETIGKASRISGITPASISILLVHLKRLGLLGIPNE